MKYVYFVLGRKIAQVPFSKLINVAHQYKLQAEQKKLNERRIIAENLIKKYLRLS
jgi:hypothetical protein